MAGKTWHKRSPSVVGKNRRHGGKCIQFSQFFLKVSEEKFLSLYDELTNLHNRRGFDFLVEQQFKIAQRTKQSLLLLFVDVDNLKWINDNIGHKEGDKALIDTADILRMQIGAANILARIGGDEFLAVISDTFGSLPEILSKRLEESLQNRNGEEMHSIKLSCSIGFARYNPSSPCSIEQLLDPADKNVYEDKKKKKKDAAS